jgi:hypothetical protein
MPPQPPPWQSHEWDDFEAARHHARLATSELSRLVELHFRQYGSDAAVTFLTIHHCIATKVTESDSLRLLQLNALFARRCAERYPRLNELSSTPTLWKLAALNYKRHPASVVTLLTFALAHIHDDLGTALVDLLSCRDIAHSEYEAVFDFILECLGRHAYRGDAENLKDVFLRLLAKHFPGSVNELIRDLRAAVWIAGHEAVAESRIRLRPSTRGETTGWLAQAYWEAEGGDSDMNWFRAEGFLDQCF